MKIECSFYIECSFFFQPIVQTGLTKDNISSMDVCLKINMNAVNHNTNLGHLIGKTKWWRRGLLPEAGKKGFP